MKPLSTDKHISHNLAAHGRWITLPYTLDTPTYRRHISILGRIQGLSRSLLSL